MAFNKTTKRVTVQPTGMPDLSGFQNAARAYDQVAQMTYKLGTSMRSAKLNNLLIEAEKAGLTAGSTYDENGDIVPLTNLDLSSDITSQVMSENERKALREAYKKGAIKTYSVSISNAAEAAATESYINNENNPSAVLSAQKTFIEELKLPPEIAPYILPSVIRKFTIAQSRANAGLLDKNKKDQVKENLANIENTYRELAVLHGQGVPEDERAEAGHTKMISELMQDIEGSFEVLKDVGGYTDTDIDQLKALGQTQIQIRMGTSHIERLYHLEEEKGGGYINALKELSALTEQFADLEIEGVDVSAIEKAMRYRLNVLKDIDDNILKADTKRKAELYSTMYLDGVQPGKGLTAEDILNADIDPQHKANLYQLIEGRASSTRSSVQKDFDSTNDDIFEGLMIPIDNDLGNERVQRSIVIIEEMKEQNLIDNKQYSRYIKAVRGLVKSQLNLEVDETMAAIEMGMRNFILTYQDLEEATPTLVKRGMVGGDSKVTLDAWQKRITAYRKSRLQHTEKAKQLFDARTALRNGTHTVQQARLMSESQSFALASDANGETILHSDAQTRDDNMSRMVNFALAYNVLHADAMDFLSNPAFDAGGDRGVELVEQKLILYDQMVNSLVKGGYGEGNTDMSMPKIEAIALMEKSGIDTVAYQMIRTQGPKKYLDTRAAISTTEGSRRLRDTEAQLGMDIEQAIRVNFADAIEPSGIGRTIADSVNAMMGWGPSYDRRDNFTINQMSLLPTGADGSYEGALIEDPRFIRLMSNEVSRLIVQTKANIAEPEDFQALLRKATINVADKIGASIDSVGNVYYELNPWYKAASASVGDAVTGGKSIPDLVFSDIRQKVLSMPMTDDRTKDLLNDEDNPIRLVPEMVTGPNQTYLVQVQDIDTGIHYNIKSGYSYDWSTSLDNGAYQAAVQRIKNSTIQRFMAVAPFIKRAFVENQMQNIINDFNDDANWIGFVEPESRIGLKEEWRNITTLLKQAYNFVVPYDDFDIDPQIDAGDVKVLRDWLQGEFANNEDYIKTLEEYYGKLD